MESELLYQQLCFNNALHKFLPVQVIDKKTLSNSLKGTNLLYVKGNVFVRPTCFEIHLITNNYQEENQKCKIREFLWNCSNVCFNTYTISFIWI